MNQAQRIQNHIAEQYAIFPEYLWRQFLSYAVFRHAKPKGKWFALFVSGSLLLGETFAKYLDLSVVQSDSIVNYFQVLEKRIMQKFAKDRGL